jgi:hypothetical protein
METLKIQLRNKNALSILQGLEKAKMIKMIPNDDNGTSSPVQYKGAFSKERAELMINEMNKSREEWESRTT